ncbi:uncharacterized protein LOC143022893 [Oratosquilla oratoria]|uniref:uncharacterized protein LOC143022893 n=1 Tax=Oratosquilla oratoria TaxID=337810 RepID=UPI003F76A12A
MRTTAFVLAIVLVLSCLTATTSAMPGPAALASPDAIPGPHRDYGYGYGYGNGRGNRDRFRPRRLLRNILKGKVGGLGLGYGGGVGGYHGYQPHGFYPGGAHYFH